jgi:hypothetical protein
MAQTKPAPVTINLDQRGARGTKKLAQQIAALEIGEEATGFTRRRQPNRGEYTPILIGATVAVLTLAAANRVSTVLAHDFQILSEWMAHVVFFKRWLRRAARRVSVAAKFSVGFSPSISTP